MKVNTRYSLEAGLENLFADIDRQIEELGKLAAYYNEDPNSHNQNEAHTLRAGDGYMITPFLSAKAEAYSALVKLHLAKEVL